MRLPGRCIVCGDTVYWNGHYWRRAGKGGVRHVCRTDRPVCNAFMPLARERCARAPGHTTEHRTRWAMDNAARKGLVA